MKANNLNDENIFSPIPGNIPEQVQDTKVVPYKYVGLLRITFPNGKTYTGTGTVIAKNAEKDSHYVLTCAYNLYSAQDGGQATKVVFIRAYNDPVQPYESVEASGFHYPVSYPTRYNESIDLDYGVVILKSAVNSVDGFPGIVVKTTEELKDLAVQINGYGFFGEKMSNAKGLIKEVGDNYIRYPISTGRGANGSAIAAQNGKEIVGIHTRTYNWEFNQGVRITERVKNEILGWML